MKKLSLGIQKIFYNIGDFSIFVAQSFVCVFTPPLRIPMVIQQLYALSIASINIIALTGISTGLIFSLQLTTELMRFGAPELTPNAVGHILAREFAPLFTSLMIISKTGSAMTVQIGTMKITEQLDALQTMSINPVQYLVGPRLIACALMLPVMAAFANLAGLFGMALILFGLLDIEHAFAIDYMLQRVSPEEIIIGISKAFFMGIAVCVICCYHGFRSKNNSLGVGRATTKAVVTASATVILMDFFMGKIIFDLGLL